MKTVRPIRRDLFLKFTAIFIAFLIVLSTTAMIDVMIRDGSEIESAPDFLKPSFQSRPCRISTVLSQVGIWIAFDSFPEGTPAETHVTVSDTSGITIVGDFHGFWWTNYSVNATYYADYLVMPGASHLRIPGAPMMPCLSEYVEVPHDVDVEVEVIASSTDTAGGYFIRPAPPPEIPIMVGDLLGFNESVIPSPPTTEGPVYTSGAIFPSNITTVVGGLSSESIIARGHRLVGLSFCPVQWDPVTQDLTVYSQIVAKVKYSSPAQIEPVPSSLQSEPFERILMNSVVNYDKCQFQYLLETGQAKTQSEVPTGREEGAEYLIITTFALESQARRLADWKKQKGVLAKVWSQLTLTKQLVKSFLMDVYSRWHPVPTYVLLFGDVEIIPANYDMDHETRVYYNMREDYGNIASDSGYFNLEGLGYVPDMIYGRISVDTLEQAEVVVNKILQYEQYPPIYPSFYSNILSAGYFEDKKPKNGREDAGDPFIYTLEKIKRYLEGSHEYNVHRNYSCGLYDAEPLYFQSLLDPTDIESYLVPDDIEWLRGYEYSLYMEYDRQNITANFDDGRFLVLYYGHGGSKNMVHLYDLPHSEDGYNREDRGLTEGWGYPRFNTTNLRLLWNGSGTPLVLSIACDTGWYDGETDQEFLDVPGLHDVAPYGNPFADYATECFAEELTRLKQAGAIAAIAPSRHAYAEMGQYLLDGFIDAFWPGFRETGSQPIYEIGGAFLYSKLYSARQWAGESIFRYLDPLNPSPEFVIRATFEEFHLFGDPETQLWTDVPSLFDVSHPISIGTYGTQKFVVTVRNDTSDEPVHFAKVCIQQDPNIYQVGYTNPAGQVIFDVESPSSFPDIDVTVTKHNFKPYQGDILVKNSGAEVSLSKYSGMEGEWINFTLSGFGDNFPIDVLMDGLLVTTMHQPDQLVTGPVPYGTDGFVNVWAAYRITYEDMEYWEPVAVTRFYRYSSTLHPDPYIYSQTDRSTWHLAGNMRVWDNPCIEIYSGDRPATSVIQDSDYEVKVTVYNRGSEIATDTVVTLSSVTFGGGTSYSPLGSENVTIDPFGSAEVSFNWTPILPNTVCLRVDLYVYGEYPEDWSDNSGEECVSVVPLCSPGTNTFQVGNPTDETDYVQIRVRQEGDYDDVWNATIVDYSSQAKGEDEEETVTLLIDPGPDYESGDERIFTIEVFINCMLLGGIEFDATQAVCPPETCCWCRCLILLLICGFAIAIIAYAWRRD